jgi:hypothetical protein
MQSKQQKQLDGARELAATADPAVDAFKPVGTNAGETRSGHVLLVEAYALFWLIAFGLLLLTWRRQRVLDRRVADLESKLAAAAAAPRKGAPARVEEK